MPRVAAVHIYPVKSLHRISPDHLDLRPWGPEGDRRWLVTDPDGNFISQRECSAMALITPTPTALGLTLSRRDMADCVVRRPNDHAHRRHVRVWGDWMEAREASQRAGEWLSAALGRPARLTYMDTPEAARIRDVGGQANPVSFADEYPILIANVASLDDLNTRLDEKLPMTRFRPNIVVEDAEAWEEDGWRRIRIGEAILRVVSPCARCGITSVDQETGEIRDRKQPLAALASFRRGHGGVMFAQNATIETPGRIAPGDTIEILERGESNLG